MVEKTLMKTKRKRPDFFIVGAPKCGTTAMAEYLGQHPEIFMPEAKDSHFFGSDIKLINKINQPPDLFRVNQNTYLSWFSSDMGAKRSGEASVMYLYSRQAAREIKEFNPHADIIIMLRNPVDMIRSLHNHCVFTLNEDLEDLKEALDAEEDRKKGSRIPETAYLIDALFYCDVARYYEQVLRYFDVFGREKVHIIIFNDLKKDAVAVYRETLCFLGVSSEFRADLKVINPAKKRRSKKIQRFIVNPPGILLPVGEALSRVIWVRKTVKKILDNLNSKYENSPSMDLELKKQLQAEFYPDIERLSELIGRDLTHWSKI